MKKLNKAQLQKLILREQKQIIKENFLLKIVDHIKKVVDDNRLKQARKDALDIDPELAQKIKNVEKSVAEVSDYLDKTYRQDPTQAAAVRKRGEDWLNSL